jgi:hypothetical protein
MTCNNPPACRQNTTCSGGTCSYTTLATDGTMDAKCGTSLPYCYSGNCVRCTTDAHCANAPSMPTCDSAGHACVCRKPSAGNKLTNPGFAGTFSGWTVYFASLAADSEGCAGSNAVYQDNNENDPWQCFPITTGYYYVGARVKGPALGSFFRIRFFTGANCTGSNSETTDLSLPGATDWTSVSKNFLVPAGTVSARIGFYGLQEYFDQVYVNAANQY